MLCSACDVAEYGAPDTTEADVRAHWREPGFDLGRDAWLATDGSGSPRGYAYVSERVPQLDLIGDLYVHPDRTAGPIGDALLDRVEERSQELASGAPTGSEPTLGLFNASVNEWKRSLLVRRGFAPARTYHRMSIDLPAAQAPPRWPAGIELRPFDRGDATLVHAAITEAFADHYRPRSEPFDHWEARHFEHEEFDPSLWLVAWDGDRVAGALLGFTLPDRGWVQDLGVRRPWRGRGLGMALLLAAFAMFRARGQRAVSLGVDSQSITGATRLYERAGMYVERRHDLYLKPLRRGA
jgi:mycothiol synthase